MTTLADALVPDELWARSSPCCRPRLARRTAVTCWRRLAEWAGAGVFDRLHLEVPDRLGEHGQLDWSRASVDTMSVCARRGGTTWAQVPSIVASLEASSLVCDGGGLSLTAAVTAADVTDTSTFEAVLDDVPAVRTPAGRRRTRPGTVHAGKGYDRGRTGPTQGAVGSGRGSPGVGSSRRPGWVGIAGGLSGHCRG
jgi:transposase